MLNVTEQRDARSLDHKTLEEMRRLAISRMLKGETQTEVARSLQVHRCTATKWMRTYQTEGQQGLESTPATGRKPTLTARQNERLKRVIIGKNPQQLNFGSALWTLALVEDLIHKLYGVVLDRSTVWRILGRLGLTAQKPVRRAFERDDEECARWAAHDFPKIVREARRRQSTLLFEDETGVHEDGPVGTTWGAKGRTPVVRTTGKRRRTNVLSVVSPRGRLWFQCYGGTLTAPRFLMFLKGILHDFRNPLDLILDRHPAHQAASVRRFVAQHPRLRLHFLPAYAPDLNPDEHVWTHLKGMFRRVPLVEGEDIVKSVRISMKNMQKDRQLIRSFFHNPEVRYIREAIKW